MFSTEMSRSRDVLIPYLNGKPMSTVSNSTHLGIERDNQSATGTKMVVKKRIVTARRTVYS
jgi:hypothetical protein